MGMELQCLSKPSWGFSWALAPLGLHLGQFDSPEMGRCVLGLGTTARPLLSITNQGLGMDLSMETPSVTWRDTAAGLGLCWGTKHTSTAPELRI